MIRRGASKAKDRAIGQLGFLGYQDILEPPPYQTGQLAATTPRPEPSHPHVVTAIFMSATHHEDPGLTLTRLGLALPWHRHLR